jgi:uncharacterized membrane protein
MIVYAFRILILGIIVLLFYAIIKGILSMSSNKKTPKKSIVDELLRLQNLKEEGIITEEEFQHMKKKLLK